MSKKIVIIDDEEQLSEMYAMRLKSMGYDVLTESNPVEGIEIVKKEQPDLVLLDVLMPQMNGRVVCEKLKEDPSTEAIPVLFLTAKNTIDDIEAELAAGAVGHITKPIDIDVLMEKLETIINNTA